MGGLTQVLANGTHSYLYGDGRIGEELFNDWQYHLSDGLGSVRQLADHMGEVTLAKGYEPYGEVLDSAGNASTSYGYAGEWTDYTGLIYLRARYYDPTIARFVTRDSWGGDMIQPATYNSWLYVLANPINLTDPSGLCARGDQPCLQAAQKLFHDYGWILIGSWQSAEVNILRSSAQQISKFYDEHGGNGQARMRGAISPIYFSHSYFLWQLLIGTHHVEGQAVYLIPGFYDEKVIHESGHVLDNLYGGPTTASLFGGGPSDDMVKYLGVDPTECILRFWCPKTKYLRLIDKAHAETPPDYGGRGPSEDFAETFMMSIKNGGTFSYSFPVRWRWMIDFIESESRTRAAYTGNPFEYIWFLPQPIPIPACTAPILQTTPQP